MGLEEIRYESSQKTVTKKSRFITKRNQKTKFLLWQKLSSYFNEWSVRVYTILIKHVLFYASVLNHEFLALFVLNSGIICGRCEKSSGWFQNRESLKRMNREHLTSLVTT